MKNNHGTRDPEPPLPLLEAKFRRFDTIDEAALWWRPPKNLNLAETLKTTPVGASELLQLAHQIPIAIEMTTQGPHVVGLLAARYHRSPPLTPEYKWRHPYVPLGVRCFPLAWSVTNGEESLALVGVVNADETHIHDDKPATKRGEQHPGAVAKIVRTLHEGMKALAPAAEALVAADLFSPLASAEAEAADIMPDLMIVDLQKLLALSPQRAAALARDGMAPLELAIASYFSYRLLPPRFAASQAMLRSAHQELPSSAPQAMEQALANLGWLDAAIDTSDLFPVGEFASDHDVIHGRN